MSERSNHSCDKTELFCIQFEHFDFVISSPISSFFRKSTFPAPGITIFSSSIGNNLGRIFRAHVADDLCLILIFAKSDPVSFPPMIRAGHVHCWASFYLDGRVVYNNLSKTSLPSRVPSPEYDVGKYASPWYSMTLYCRSHTLLTIHKNGGVIPRIPAVVLATVT